MKESELLRFKQISDCPQFASHSHVNSLWNRSTRLMSASLFVVFVSQHADFLNILLMIIFQYISCDFAKLRIFIFL